jgi:hypothetical protein
MTSRCGTVGSAQQRRLAHLARSIDARAPKVDGRFTHLGRPIHPSSVGALVEMDALALEQPGGLTALRRQMDAEGYVLVRGLLSREHVMAARDEVLGNAAGHPTPEPQHLTAARAPLLHAVLRAGPMMSFFEALLGGTVRPLDYTWWRVKPPRGEGRASNPHCDSIFMDRGSHGLLTAWTPFSDIALEGGGLMLLEGSYRRARYGGAADRMHEYARQDIDAHCANDPLSVAAVKAAQVRHRLSAS